jgi:hypothetical protein
MPMRVVSGKSKLMRAGLCTGILRLRAPMVGILLQGKENVLIVERNHFRKLWYIFWSMILASNPFYITNTWI